jgi:hypothetical protein
VIGQGLGENAATAIVCANEQYLHGRYPTALVYSSNGIFYVGNILEPVWLSTGSIVITSSA